MNDASHFLDDLERERSIQLEEEARERAIEAVPEIRYAVDAIESHLDSSSSTLARIENQARQQTELLQKIERMAMFALVLLAVIVLTLHYRS